MRVTARATDDDEHGFEEHTWVAQVQLLGGRLVWANVPATSTGKAPTRADLLEHWFKGGDVPYVDSTRCVWEQIVDPMLFGRDGDEKTRRPLSSHKRSMCELLFRNNANAVRQGQIGQANVFISHSTGNSWAVLLGAVREYCDVNKLHPSEVRRPQIRSTNSMASVWLLLLLVLLLVLLDLLVLLLAAC
jgi:hypothetical protein